MRTKKNTKEIEIRLVDKVKAYLFPTFLGWVGLIMATNVLVSLVTNGTAKITYDNIWGIYIFLAVYITHKLKKRFNF